MPRADLNGGTSLSHAKKVRWSLQHKWVCVNLNLQLAKIFTCSMKNVERKASYSAVKVTVVKLLGKILSFPNT